MSYARVSVLGEYLPKIILDVPLLDRVVLQVEALHLSVMEQRLIKRHQPDYNVMWKDGKSYPWVALSRVMPKNFCSTTTTNSMGV